VGPKHATTSIQALYAANGLVACYFKRGSPDIHIEAA
jgi:hypothetical protein